MAALRAWHVHWHSGNRARYWLKVPGMFLGKQRQLDQATDRTPEVRHHSSHSRSVEFAYSPFQFFITS